ncbi:MAG: hypothetical protein GYB35_11310 [Algicola sp.]|nr:hypothetical protein [Algicola sp.]
MKLTEKLLGALIIILMVTRLIVAFPYSSIAITLSMLLLTMLYFWFSFALLNNIRLRSVFKSDAYKGISGLRLTGTILTGFVLSSLIIYALFKFQRWPYGNEGLLISLYGIAIVAVVASVKYFTTKHTFYNELLTRLFLIGIVGTALYMTSYETLLEIQHRDHPDYVEAEKNSMRDPQNRELQQKALEERQKMDMDHRETD